MAKDWYSSYEELRLKEREGADFAIRLDRRPGPVAIIAPHGGHIEPGTSELAEAIAADAFSLYCFEGLRDRPHCELHITSTRFDEPRCLELIAACEVIIAVHGLCGQDEAVSVGGLDGVLRVGIHGNLRAADFTSTIISSGPHGGVSPSNICNRGRSRSGVQVEITRALRDRLKADKALQALFADAVQRAIHVRLRGTTPEG